MRYTGGYQVVNRQTVGQEADGNIVDVVVAIAISAGGDIAESNIAAVASIAVEIDSVFLGGRGAGANDGVDGHKGSFIGKVAHHTHSQMIGGGGLFHPEVHLQEVDVGVHGGQGIDAAVVETQAVAATMRIGGTIINLRIIGSCRPADILMGQSPAVGLHAGGGGGAGGIAVEILKERHAESYAGGVETDIDQERSIVGRAVGLKAEKIVGIGGQASQRIAGGGQAGSHNRVVGHVVNSVGGTRSVGVPGERSTIGGDVADGKIGGSRASC